MGERIICLCPHRNGYLHGTRSRGSAKSAIYTAAGCQHKIAISTAAVPEPFQDKKLIARGSHAMLIYTAVIIEPNRNGHFDGSQRN